MSGGEGKEIKEGEGGEGRRTKPVLHIEVTTHLMVSVIEEHRKVVLFHRISQLHVRIHKIY